MKTALLSAAITAAALVAPASAQLLTYEGFDYAVGETLTDKSGGTGWDAN